MAEQNSGSRLAAILWFVAAVLAWAAAAIRYVRISEVAWYWAAAGLFFLVMGFSALKKSRATDTGASHRDAGTR
jgi:hypothetical protein